MTSWGTPRDLSTWSAPAAGGLAWRQRACELAAVAAVPAVSDRALRELLALQSSDWAFLVSAGTAGEYPAERAAGHAEGFAAALADPDGLPPAIRNLAPQLAPGRPRLRPDRGVSSAECVCSPARFEPAESPPPPGGGERGTHWSQERLTGRIAAGVRRSAGLEREPDS